MAVKKRNYSYPDIASIKRVLGAANVAKIVNSHYPRLMIDALHKKFAEKQDWKKAEAVAALERYLNKATEKQARRHNPVTNVQPGDLVYRLEGQPIYSSSQRKRDAPILNFGRVADDGVRVIASIGSTTIPVKHGSKQYWWKVGDPNGPLVSTASLRYAQETLKTALQRNYPGAQDIELGLNYLSGHIKNGFGTNLAASMIAPIAMEAVEKASKNLQYGAKKVTTGKGKKNPVRALNSKRIEELTPAQLKEQLSKSEKVVSALNQKLIDAGRGRDKFNDTIAKASTGDRLAAEYVAAAERQRDLFLERERRLRYSGTLKPIKTNPSVTDISEMFQGKASGKSEDLKAAWGAPANLSRAGKFAWLKIEGRRLPLRVPGAVVAIDTKGRLWLASKHAPMFTKKAHKGEGLDYGEIESIAYITAKAHIGDGKTFEYIHEFGEEGGRRPHLIIDDEGMPIIKGGDYTIRSEGIIN